MKNIKLIVCAFSLMLLFSCGKKEEKETIIEKETVVAPNGETPPPAPEPKNPDGTSVKVGDGGISVSTKSGNNNTQINMTKDSAGVIIKK